MPNMRVIFVLLSAICLCCHFSEGALAGKKLRLASWPPSNDVVPSVAIGSDRGGVVIQYGLRMLRWRQNGTRVRFSGACQSACTLYLGLASRQICIAPGASFGFHSPFGATGRGNAIAQSFMMRNYPGWVRSWIRGQGGLSSSIKTMGYGYASRFIEPCGSSTIARRGSGRSHFPTDG
jgi:hypothetical protein